MSMLSADDDLGHRKERGVWVPFEKLAMKNVLLPLEGSSYHRSLLEFAAALNERSKLVLTATLMPGADDGQPWTAEGWAAGPACRTPVCETDKAFVNHGARVKHFCDEHSIDCRIRGDRFDVSPGITRTDLRFADFVLLSNSRFFEATNAHRANAYMKKLLRPSWCPVLFVPVKPTLPGEIILTYDGSASSVYAIRQFADLFPEFSRLRTTLVCLDDDADVHLPKETMIREWCEQHFRHFRACRLHRRTDGFYDAWIGMLDQPWLISGGGRRGDWSRLFEHGFINRLVRTHGVPLFVAHR